MAEVDPHLSWLLGVLWEEGEDVLAIVDDRVPHGFRIAESYAVVPSLAHARFLVPLVSRRAASASLRRYNALRPPAMRARREAVSLLMRAGVGRRVFHDRVHVCVREGMGEGALADALLARHLEETLGRDRLACAFGVGRQGPNRKPVAQVFAASGRPVAFVKLGWNGFTRDLVRNEARALRELSAAPRDGLWTPEVLYDGSWRGLEVSAVAPLPLAARRPRPARVPPPVRVSRNLAEPVVREPLAESAYANALRRRLAALDPRAAGPGERLLARMLGEHGRAVVQFGAWHGDWVPWNLARSGDRIVAWDWEHSASAAPVGLDLVHFHTQVAFVRDRLELPRSLAWGERAAMPSLRALGLDHLAAALAPRLYLLELYVRYEEAAGAGAGRNPRLYPAILREMERAAGAP